MAIISVGSSPVFYHIKSITQFLKIPYISIKWENEEQKYKLLEKSTNSQIEELIANDIELKKQQTFVNLHPPANQLIRVITDLIVELNWEFVTIIYSESTGPSKVQDLINLPSTNIIKNRKFRLQVKQLSVDINKWVYLMKEVALSGSSHIIIDIENKHFRDFVKIVNEKKNFFSILF